MNFGTLNRVDVNYSSRCACKFGMANLVFVLLDCMGLLAHCSCSGLGIILLDMAFDSSGHGI